MTDAERDEIEDSRQDARMSEPPRCTCGPMPETPCDFCVGEIDDDELYEEGDEF